jgi:hypothetical protein
VPCFFLYNQIVLDLQEDGKLTTSDDPPVVFGSLDNEFIQKVLLCNAAYIKKSDNYIGLYAFMVPRFLRVEICIRVPSTWCSKLLVVDMKPMNGYVDCIPYLEVLQCYAYKVTCLS